VILLVSAKHSWQHPAEQRIGNLFLGRYVNQGAQGGNLPDGEIFFLQVDKVMLKFDLFQVFSHRVNILNPRNHVVLDR
jgi:hypothetical protein